MRPDDRYAALTAENARLRDRLAVVLDELHLPGDALPGAEIAGIGDLLRENARLRGELELWKAAEEMRGRQLAAVACERNAYSEEAEKIEASLAPHRRPGQDTLAVIAALTADLARVTGERDGLRDMVRQYQEQWDNEVAWGLALRRECGARDEETMPRFAARLSRERDALLAAAKMALDGHRKFEDHLGTKIDGPPWVRALRAAVVACAPPASGEVKP